MVDETSKMAYFAKGDGEKNSEGSVNKGKNTKKPTKNSIDLNDYFSDFSILTTPENPQLVVTMTSIVTGPKKHFLYEMSQLSAQDKEYYKALDTLLTELKLAGICDNQNNLPAEKTAYFFDEHLRQYIKYCHTDVAENKNAFLQKDLKPIRFVDYSVEENKVVFSLDKKTLTKENQLALGSLLNKLLKASSSPGPKKTF